MNIELVGLEEQSNQTEESAISMKNVVKVLQEKYGYEFITSDAGVSNLSSVFDTKKLEQQ